MRTHDAFRKVSCFCLLAILITSLGLFGAFQPHLVQAVIADDWPTYLHDVGRSGFNSTETIINSTSAPNLKLKWTAKTNGCTNSPGGPVTISTQPVEVQALQIIFWGSWDGCEHATNLSGTELWATYLGQITGPKCAYPSTVGVASTPTVIREMVGGVLTPVILLGGGDANFYALNATTGAVIWKTSLSTGTGSFLWSSPVVYHGSVYEGLASQLDCPLVRGRLYQLNYLNGIIQHVFSTAPGGCRGASVWGSPAIDTAAGTLYLATGNPSNGCPQPEPYAVSIIELNASNLAFIGSWQVPPSQQVPDSDFGSTPTLFQATIGGVVLPMVGIENKNGSYYAFQRGNLGLGPVWQTLIGDGEIFSPSAWDGNFLYVAGGHANISGTTCVGTNNKGSLQALDPATGAFRWQDCFPSGNVLGAVTAVPGLAVVGAGTTVEVVNTSSGQILFTYTDTNSSTVFYGAATIANGVLYIGDSSGNLYAFGL